MMPDAPPDPTPSLITNLADMVIRIKQFTPLNLLDGAWLRDIAKAGPTDEVHSLLFSIWMDEFGGGDTSRNHCNIYVDLCHSVGFYPHPLELPAANLRSTRSFWIARSRCRPSSSQSQSSPRNTIQRSSA